MTRRPRSMRVITTIILLTIVSIALVAFPLSHHASARADQATTSSNTGSMYYNCDLPQGQQSEGYTFWPCQPSGIGSSCLNIHKGPFLNAPVVMCAYPSQAADGVFDVVCQTSGDKVAGTNLWDKLIAPDDALAYVSDHYIDTSKTGPYAPLSPNIPWCGERIGG